MKRTALCHTKTKMDQTQELLQCVYKNARMGAQAINAILPKTEDVNMRKVLVSYLARYDENASAASEEMVKRGGKAKEPPAPAQAATDLMVQMKANLDRRPTHLAEMLVQGANMGVIETTRMRNSSPDADPAAQQIAGVTNELNQQLIRDMQHFL